MFKTRNRIGVSGAGSKSKVVSYVATDRGGSSGARASRTPEMAFMSGMSGMMGGGGGNSVSAFTGGPGLGARLDLMMTGLVPHENEAMLRMFYRDIYKYDAVAGSCVDLMSIMPFSPFSLTGADASSLEPYESSVERLNVKTMLPELSIEYLVNGAYISSLIFDTNTKEFIDQIPYSLNNASIETLPMYGRDPQITVRPDEEMRRFLSSTDPYIKSVRESMPQKLMQSLKQGAAVLDPLTTVYIPRRTFANSKGQSFFARVLPIYLLEKILYRGTIVEATKRQRAMLHVQVGDENWEPTGDELSAYTQMFQQGELDPLGAVLTTRAAVNVAEIRQGGDFWKWTDILGDTTNMKLRALGISEAFLARETNLATQENSVTVFTESLKAYRGMTTQRLFYDKIFPIVALANKRFKKGVSEDDIKRFDRQFHANDASKLLIPQVHWHKSLEPKNDRDMFEMLQTLQEHGVPVPIRAWCAAGGIEVESLLRDLQDDVSVRQRIQKFTEGLDDSLKPFGIAEGEGTDSSEATLARLLRKTHRIPLLSRNFGDPEILGESKTGKKKAIYNQRRAEQTANAHIALAVQSLADPHHYEQVRRRVESRIGRSATGYGRVR